MFSAFIVPNFIGGMDAYLGFRCVSPDPKIYHVLNVTYIFTCRGNEHAVINWTIVDGPRTCSKQTIVWSISAYVIVSVKCVYTVIQLKIRCLFVPPSNDGDEHLFNVRTYILMILYI